MPADWIAGATALGGVATSVVTAIGGVLVGGRRARGKARESALEDRVQLDKSTGALLDRLERDVRRLDLDLSEERRHRARCEEMHRECTETTDQLRRRVVTLEERFADLGVATTPDTPPERES